MSAFERTTARLRLRRPRPADLDAYVALHTDPRTYTHAPETMRTPEGARERLEFNLAHWATYDFGYLAVEDRASGELVGWAGLSDADRPVLNLYYRLRHASLGRGLGREIARAVVEAYLAELPHRRMHALVLPHNPASLATARAAGLLETGFTQGHLVFEPPRVETLTASGGGIGDDLREEILDLWVRVNDAGGAVGFTPGAPRAEVAAELAVHEDQVADARASLGLLREPDGRLVGLGFWVRGGGERFGHVLTLVRLMVDPARQGGGGGRRLMSALHGIARRLPDAELWRLNYRSGTGVGDFYAGLGWVETGRQPRGLWFAGGERRDDVAMARRPDGAVLVYADPDPDPDPDPASPADPNVTLGRRAVSSVLAGFEADTPRLRLRRPVPGDVEDYVALHTDPRTYTHAPDAMPDEALARQRFADNLRDWERFGFGHVAVHDVAADGGPGQVLGWGGSRPAADDPDGAFLYYRLAAAVLGRGLGRELALACVETHLEQLPARRLRALVKAHNAASLATARTAGLVETGRRRHREDRAGDPPSIVLEAPHVEVIASGIASGSGIGDALRAEILDLWVRVDDAGGAVGFTPGASRAAVAAALAIHEAQVATGQACLGLLRDADGRLLGLGFWVRGSGERFAHVLALQRLMVDPEHRSGGGTARRLMAALHGVARGLPDVELWRLDHRGGGGLGEFYAGLGWVQTGRQPRALWFPDGVRRDDVAMARRPDGGPLRPDGRH